MTSTAISVKEFLQQSTNQLIVDVRAPIEFDKGHVTNAINIPLFEDIERAEIGTLYKQQGKEVAVTRGLEIVSPKLVPFVNTIKALTKNKKVFVYCFRGGMRSNSFAWLMNTSGLEAVICNGGYKAYRNYVLADFDTQRKFIILGGMTGSGKTHVLKQLTQFQTIDLEGLANHKGSAFGSINEQKQKPQQVFENNLHHKLNLVDKSQAIILEDESQNIGFNKLPQGIWLQMKQAPILKLIIPFNVRVQKLVTDYSTTNIDALKACVIKIQQSLGTLNTKLCLQYLDENNLEDVARLTLNYYDKVYGYTYNNKKTQRIIELPLNSINTEDNLSEIKLALQSLI